MAENRTKFEKSLIAMQYVLEDKLYARKAKDAPSEEKEKRTWLISERGDDAQDNGYVLYKYLIEHPEEGITPVYVIDTLRGDDGQKIWSLHGKFVLTGTPEHHMMMQTSEALISTHTYGFTPNKDIYYRLAQKNLYNPKGANIFLSHGVTDKDMPWLYRENFKPDMFVVSCNNEYELVRSKYNQPEDVVKECGMPRYDNLYDVPAPKKQILIMPTWRVWLNGLTDEDFMRTNYFLYWNDLLSDAVFKKTMHDEGYDIIFYLHPELKKKMHLFMHDGIYLRDSGIQDLMKESELLVTDYSSVFSDMAYMGRKIVFYQFDKRDYEAKHYKGLITEYDKFGVVVDPSADYVGVAISKVLNEPNVADTNYIWNKYFIHHDTENCKRVVSEIKATIASKKYGESNK